MTTPVLRRWLRDNRRATIGWAAGLALVVLMYLPLFPSLTSSGALQSSVDSLPPDVAEAFGMTQMSDGAGYAQSTVFGLLGMLLLTIAAIGAGARAVAGDEERGGLELTLAHAVSRSRVTFERAAGVALTVVALAFFVGLLTLTLNTPAQLDLSLSGIVAVTLALAGLALVHGCVALAIGAATGSRVAAMGGAAAVAVLGYLLHTLGPQLSGGAGLGGISPFQWAYGADPLSTGPDWTGLALLVAAASLLVAAATALLNRRDIAS